MPCNGFEKTRWTGKSSIRKAAFRLAAFCLVAGGLGGCLRSHVEGETHPPKFSVDGRHTSLERLGLYRDTLRIEAGISRNLVFVLTEAPEGATVVDSVVTWTPYQVGEFKFTATANDNETGLQFIHSWVVHVARENLAPQIQTLAEDLMGKVVVGGNYKDTLSVFDANGDVISWHSAQPLSWLTLSDSVLAIHPVAGDTGTHEVSLIAEDGRGGADTLKWIFRISKDDRQVCGFRMLDAGTTWTYRTGSSPVQSPVDEPHIQVVSVDSVGMEGDYDLYGIHDSTHFTIPIVRWTNGSYMLAIADGIVRTWTASGPGPYTGFEFATDCADEYLARPAEVFGANVQAITVVRRRDQNGLPMDFSVRVQGIGLVHAEIVWGTGRHEKTETMDLIGFNGRNIKVESLDPLKIVYE